MIIDFFTYCCINCLHILETLEKIEQKFSHSIQVIGYHSPKFDNEKVEANVENAIKRYGIKHPVVCGDGKLWDEMGIFCWPTVLILGHNKRVLFNLVGELTINQWLEKCVQGSIEFYSGLIEVSQTTPKHGKVINQEQQLSFPGKVTSSPDSSLIAVSDTGNHRLIVLSSEDYTIKYTIGGYCGRGFSDGSFQTAQFDSPQGTAWSQSSHKLYVADTNNHAIRCIDLETQYVETLVCSNGEDNKARIPANSSPWDLCLVNRDKLLIAMAGLHQIWLLCLADEAILFRKSYRKEQVEVIAGNGNEENRNNLYPLKAGFAQPSGICYSSRNECVYVADSESSSIRIINLSNGSVKNLVGGSKDPLDLFSFGDRDGSGHDVRLQHPMAVSCDPDSNRLFVADTYNHKMKEIDIESRECKTIFFASINDTKRVNSDCRLDNSCFNEPSGLNLVAQKNILLVADTNNHVIKKIELNTGSISQINLITRPMKQAKDLIVLEAHQLILGQKTIVAFDFTLSGGLKLNEGNIIDIKTPDFLLTSANQLKFNSLDSISEISLEPLAANKSCQVFIDVKLFVCSSKDGTCFVRKLYFSIPISILSDKGLNHVHESTNATLIMIKQHID